MFKKIELWVVLLICIIFFIISILYGSLLRNHYMGGEWFPTLRKIAVFVAETPTNIKNLDKVLIRIQEGNKIIIENEKDMPPNLPKHFKKKRFKRFIETKRDALLILPRYNGNLQRSIVEIIDLNTFDVLHTYKHDIDKMNNSVVNTSNTKFSRIKIDDSLIRFEYRHPLILENGDLISHGEYYPLFKMDFCSNLLWINQKEKFHHSINIDADGNIFVGAAIYPYSKYIRKYIKNSNFIDDAITKINLDGKIIYKKSISELLYENGILKESDLFTFAQDPIHLNDIEPTLNTTEYWEKGDLFISIRTQSAIIHYRPSTNEVISYIKGPFYEQHDVDIISDKEISIFNNNNSDLENSKNSEILIYNLETKKFSKKLDQQLQENDFKTKSQGLSEILKDGSKLVEEQNHGRLIFFNNNGDKEWEFINKDDNENIYFISWSRIIEEKDLIDKLKHKIKKAKCSS